MSFTGNSDGQNPPTDNSSNVIASPIAQVSALLAAKDVVENPCVSAPPFLVDHFMASSKIPPDLEGRNFLGYFPINFIAEAERLPNEFLLSSYDLLIGTKPSGFENTLSLVTKKLCDTETRFDDTVNKPVTAEYLATSKGLLKKHWPIIDELSMLSYENKVGKIIIELLKNFREALYVDTGEISVPKTVTALETDQTGLCRDFALSRYNMARLLGVKDEHLFIVAYLNADPNGPAHANLAVYNPERKLWTIVDGTGRSADQIKGETFSYENEGKSWEIIKPYVQDLIPVAGINSQGIFLLDSIDHENSVNQAIFKPRKPLPKTSEAPKLFNTRPIPRP